MVDLVGRVASLASADAVRRFLRKTPQLHRRAAVEILTNEVARLVYVDLDQAERLAEAARWVARRLGDDYSQARAARATANALYARGHYQQAAEHYASALEGFSKLGEDVEAGRTLSSSMQNLIYLGRYEEAQASAERARAIFEGVGDRLRLGRLDSNLGNLLYRQDRFDEALVLYQRAHRELSEAGEPRDVAIALRNMAVCHISLNRFPEALETHRAARAYSEEHGLPLLVVEADYNIAYLYYLRGEYTKAIELYIAARERCEELGDNYHRALCDLDQSELYLELNLIEEGVQLASQAFEGFDTLGMGYEAAKALTNLAIGAGRQGEAFRALGLFEKAREMFVGEDNFIWPALIDVYRALVLQQEGRHFEARRYGEAALEFFTHSGLASRAALCELLLARVYLSIGELRSARAKTRDALARLEEADAPDLSYRAHFLLGQVEEALGDRENAFRAYRAAQARLENLRSHLEQDELKIGFLKDKLAVYESLVWMTLGGERGPEDLEATLAYIEQAKSRSLADLLAFRAQLLPARGSAQSGLVQEVHGLRQELNWYNRRIDLAEIRPDRHSPEQIARLRQETRDREAQLLRTLRDLGPRDREFASLQAAGTIGLAAIRESLPPDAVILEYYESRGTVIAVIVTRDRLEILPLTPASRVRHLLRLLQFQLSRFRLGRDYEKTFSSELFSTARAHLRDLYAELVAPIRRFLRAGHLIVVPHDVLHYVPFAALLDGDRYLIDDFVVSYAPSASVHHFCRTRRADGGAGSLILGVPDAATPHIVDEVEAVAAALPDSRLFLGEAASEETLRQFGPKSRFVHIATHGLFRYDNPMFSSVQLGGSRLSLFDLYQLDLQAELVTLSGCGTGLNVVEGGDELMGMVRGLLYAGTKAALVTLWDVNDQSTCAFMKRFYRHLEGGSSRSRAVQEAMRELREDYPHPYFWAPFFLVGDGRGEK
jgi:CHAT domain-containing protein